MDADHQLVRGVLPVSGVGHGGGAEGARAPPPKIGKNIFQEIISYHVKCGHFCGKYHVKFRNFANFRANIMSNLKFGHFVNFSYIYFRAKMSCTPKVD